EVVIARDPRRHPGLDEGVDQFVPERLIGNLERTADPVPGILAARLVFRLLEVRQHAGPVPALAAALAPAVIIGGMAAHVDHAIEGTGATQHLAARLIGGAVVESGDRFALELPVVAG